MVTVECYLYQVKNWFPLPLNVSLPGGVSLAQHLIHKLYRSHPACLSANTFPTSPWWWDKNIMELAQQHTRPLIIKWVVWEEKWTEMLHKCMLTVTKWRLNKPARVGNLHELFVTTAKQAHLFNESTAYTAMCISVFYLMQIVPYARPQT